MRARSFLAAASAIALTSAQDLATALSGQESLSTLVELLGQFTNTTDFLASQQDVTLFAPNNDALADILSSGGIFSAEQASADEGLIEQILRYHLIRGAVPSSAVTEIPQFVPTYLNYSGIVLDGEVSGSNVTGGQVVSVALDGSDVVVTSGIKATSVVTVADIAFDNGVVHIIDQLLTIPLSVSVTLITANLTALAGAATQAGLVEPLRSSSDITIFAPNNDAFQAIAAATADLSIEDLTAILQYHVVPSVAYSTDLSNTTLPTLHGSELEITITPDGATFVDGARIINTDILIPNGVVHVIDQVLSPTVEDPQPGEDAIPTAAGSVVPFTSVIPSPTSTFTEISVLDATTSFVAAGPVTAAPSAAGNGSAGNGTVTTSGAPVQQTENTGPRKEMPFLGAAVAVGAMAFAMDL